jgi:tyrosinase
MAKFTRKNAWIKNGTFDNPDLLWYAKGVGIMQSRSLDDASSWWFFAAIHGQYLSGETSFPGWGYIPGPTKVPTSPVPSRSVQDLYWDQCQHQSWYFAPWHRGYLLALEAQIRAAIVSLGGPKDWSLPYWNYFGPNKEYTIPPAFTQPTLPDGKPNPLYVKARYGPKNNGVIYIRIPPVSQVCQGNTIYTGSNAATPRPGYGGPVTKFWHGGGTSGNLESNPHNKVHTEVGGIISATDFGLMSDPGVAALDPIFYIHHCNIDRMWASWNAAGHSNPTDQNWLKGPAATGDRKFIMPLPGGKPWTYTPADVNSLSQLDYTYDDLKTVKAVPPMEKLTQRLFKLGGKSTDTLLEKHMDGAINSELAGANEEPLLIRSSGARTTVRLNENAWKKVPMSLMKASTSNLPDRVYLQLENVKGKMDANILTVTVNHQHAGYISLFGLRRASKADSAHGGGGLSFLLDITDVIDTLHLSNSLDANTLDVMIMPGNEIPANSEISVGRVSIYREGQQ